MKLAKLMETKGEMLLKNVKTCQIFMLSATWCVMTQYKTLLMKMAFEAPSNDKAKAKFEFLCDV